jgi:Ca2+-binding RTX toxin-like protein
MMGKKMPYTNTTDNITFDYTQSGVNIWSADGTAMNFSFADIANYITNNPNLIISQQYSDFYYNGFVNLSASNLNDLINPFSYNQYNNYGIYIRYNIDAGDGNDSVDVGFSEYACFLNGGSGDDSIYGSNFDDTITGGAGDDLIYTYGGNGITDGGDGNDVIYTYSNWLVGYGGQSDAASGGNGDDAMYGTGNGLDYLYGDAGNDTIDGGDGDDVLNGGADDDRVVGNTGDDTLDGGIGNDLLIGGQGWDNVTGGAGNDVFGVRMNSIRDYITDFTVGEDTIRIDTAIAYDFASLEANSDMWTEGNWGVIQVYDGPMILLWGVDTTQLTASSFDFNFV